MENEKVRTIRLYGKLGAKFGRVHRYVCNNTAEAVGALCNMVPGFKQELMSSKEKGVGYACFIGKENIDEDRLKAPVGDEDIRIAPMIVGSGSNGGLFSIIGGVALMVASVWTGGATFYAGLALAAGGVVQMVTPIPQGMTGTESADNGASYNFNGPVNVTAQGNPIPVLYGEAIVGGNIVSVDMVSEDSSTLGRGYDGDAVWNHMFEKMFPNLEPDDV